MRADETSHPAEADGEDRPVVPVAVPTSSEFEQLQRLLLAGDREQMAELRHELESRSLTAEDVAGVLPQAVLARSGSGDALGRALAPTVERALAESIRTNPRPMAEALFPIMGPAIRQSIATTLRGMVDSLNQILENSFSLRGLRWRWEAMRTGRSFGEVALLHSLVYRVEQIFLIHRDSGLLLQHVVSPNVQPQDADMVSGMLTAIRSFVQDSFGLEGDASVDTLHVGNRSVWTVQQPRAVLAAAIRGNAPDALRVRLRETLEMVHARHSADLLEYDGDPAPFEASRRDLEDCLLVELQKPERKRSPLLPAVIAAIVLIPFALGLWRFVDVSRWSAYVERLNAEPGIVVTDERRGWRRLTVRGLRDPLAADPAELMATSAIAPERVDSQWKSYFAFDREIALERARRTLDPPEGVRLALSDGMLTADGPAPADWIRSVRTRTVLLPGIDSIDTSGLVTVETAHREALVERLEQSRVAFDVSSDIFVDPGAMDAVARTVLELLAASDALATETVVEVVGRSDDRGPEPLNLRISRQRAERVMTELVTYGVPEAHLVLRAYGSRAPIGDNATPEGRAVNRSVSFYVSP